MAPESSADFSIPPQDTVVGSPRPRNDSVDSATIALPTARVVLASTSGSTAGSTCLPSTCRCPPPSTCARSMNGRASMVSVWARTSRAVDGQAVTPIATMIVRTPRSSTVDSTIASTSDGSTRKKSVSRSSTADSQPPKCAATIPTTVPITTDSTVAATPTSSEIRVPVSVSASTDSPFSSVPSGNSALGGTSTPPVASTTERCSGGTTSGAASATSSTSSSTAAPTTPGGWAR